MKFFIALFLYRVLFLLLLPVVLILLLLRSKKSPEYRQRLGERLGFTLGQKPWKQNGVVLHAASVGEVLALKPLIEKYLHKHPETPLTVTTFTPTGSAQVIKLFGNRVQHCYLPIDNIVSTWLFLRALKPQTMIFMETELWPNLLAQCANKQIKLLLINGRLSAKSLPKYAKLKALMAPSLNLFSKILTQSEDNLHNFIALGAEPERCANSGNLKYDISITPEITAKQTELASQVQVDKKLWIMASTHEGDEAIALKAFKQLRATQPNLVLVLIPRHPERFDSVASLCQSPPYQLNVSRRSESAPVTENTQVWLIDTLGELLPTCALANIVTMGGSFSHIGGHNPLEPALFKKPIIVGPDMNNFKEVNSQLLAANGIEQLLENLDMANLLAERVANYLNSPELCQTTGENAFIVVQANQGASEKTLSEINALISQKK